MSPPCPNSYEYEPRVEAVRAREFPSCAGTGAGRNRRSRTGTTRTSSCRRRIARLPQQCTRTPTREAQQQ
eukprot:scaffold560910_cov41-Prasinocladus_malaysianus.AAC.1